MAKILIVEDDYDIRTTYMYAFTHAGMEVEGASDANEAIAILEQSRPDFILLDMLMPGLSGLDFLRQSAVTQRYPDTKIIAFSNIDTPRVVDQAKELGVSEYILKVEMTPHKMLQVINNYGSKTRDSKPRPQ